MSQTSAAKAPGRLSKVLGIIIVVIGAMMMVGGIVAWTMVSSNLREEQMVVPGDSPSHAGQTVAGPLTAWSMQSIINHHAMNATDGQTYAELGTVVNDAREEFGEDSEEAAAAQGLRNTAMNASLLRASLFTSILAFGVSALALGTGLIAVLTGVVFIRRESELVEIEASSEEIIL